MMPKFEESLHRVDSLVPLMHHNLSDLGSLILIWIIPKEYTLTLHLPLGFAYFTAWMSPRVAASLRQYIQTINPVQCSQNVGFF